MATSKTLYKQLREFFEARDWPWEPCQTVGLIDYRTSDKEQWFNDLFVIPHTVKGKDEILLVRCTLQSGKLWTPSNKKLFLGSEKAWPGEYLEGHFLEDFWKASRYRLGWKKVFCLRPSRFVEVLDLETSGLRPANDMLVHPRKSNGEAVQFASAGCIVPYRKEGMDAIEKVTKPFLKYRLLNFVVLQKDIFNYTKEAHTII